LGEHRPCRACPAKRTLHRRIGSGMWASSWGRGEPSLAQPCCPSRPTNRRSASEQHSSVCCLAGSPGPPSAASLHPGRHSAHPSRAHAHEPDTPTLCRQHRLRWQGGRRARERRVRRRRARRSAILAQKGISMRVPEVTALVEAVMAGRVHQDYIQAAGHQYLITTVDESRFAETRRDSPRFAETSSGAALSAASARDSHRASPSFAEIARARDDGGCRP